MYAAKFARTESPSLPINFFMGALIIIPAVTAKRLARNLTEMLLIAVLVAVAATAIGTLLASRLHQETGPVIVTVAACFFSLSFLRW